MGDGVWELNKGVTFDGAGFLHKRFTAEQIVFLLRQKEFADALQDTREETQGDLENLAHRLLERF